MIYINMNITIYVIYHAQMEQKILKIVIYANLYAKNIIIISKLNVLIIFL